MFEQQPESLQQKVKSLATESIAQNNPTGWFETLYSEAKGDSNLVPWAKNQAHPYLQDWLKKNSICGDNRTALVIGCGLGDDAEILASLGYQVTAFDISPTAIDWCQKRFPNSSVNYVVGDLLAANLSWQNKFDLVYECRDIQALPIAIRSQVIQAVASCVANSGTLLIITRYRKDDRILTQNPPWALSESELSQFLQLGFQEIQRDSFLEGNEIKIEQLRIEYKYMRNNSSTKL